MIKHLFRFFSRITVRLLLFNILLVFLPITFFFYLDIYEKELLQAQESSMVMQARIVSAALKSSTALEDDAKNIIENLGRDVTSRIRVTNRDGLLLADSVLG